MAESHPATRPEGTPTTAASPAAAPATGDCPDQPQAGAEAAGSPTPRADAGEAQQPKTRDGREWRGDWQITVVVAALILALVGGLLYLNHAHHRGNVSLPATLLELHKVTTPQTLQWAHQAIADERATSGALGAPVAAVYSDSTGGGFAVIIGTPCPSGSCIAPTTRQLVQSAQASGHPDATGFPPGPPGGELVCYSDVFSGGKAVDCSWIDQVTAAKVTFIGGYAPTLADAAAKTRQLRDAIEH